MDLLQLRGIKVAPAQWMSVYKAGHAWDESLADRALVLSSLCMKKGWILTEEDLFSCTRLGATSCGDKPDPKSKAAGVRDATQKLRAFPGHLALLERVLEVLAGTAPSLSQLCGLLP